MAFTLDPSLEAEIARLHGLGLLKLRKLWAQRLARLIHSYILILQGAAKFARGRASSARLLRREFDSQLVGVRGFSV